LDISICIIYVFSGKIVPTKYLWVGNIPIDIKRRDLEHAFSRYGQIKTLDYSTGDPTAIVTYSDIEDAIKAREKLTGTIQLINGRVIRNESDASSRHGKKRRMRKD
jgi:RNA recognition motif-containing protein